MLGVNSTLYLGGRDLAYQLSFLRASQDTSSPNGLVRKARGFYGELVAVMAKGLGVLGPIDVLKLSFGLFCFLDLRVGYNLLDNLGKFLGSEILHSETSYRLSSPERFAVRHIQIVGCSLRSRE